MKSFLSRYSAEYLALKIARLRHRYFDDFVFIHINKTGGSSVEKALKIPFEHKTALEKIDELGRKAWERKFTFAIIRNPWDKVVSHFHWRVKMNTTSLGDQPVPFREWVKLAYGDNDPRYYDIEKMFMPQTDWIADSGGQILVDHTCRFENLNEDFDFVARKLGIDTALPHIKPSKRGNYRDYYDDNTMAIVAQWFAKDIKNFGYEF